MKTMATTHRKTRKKCSIQHSNTQNISQHLTDDSSLESVARNTLCQLSQNICLEEITQRKKHSFFKKSSNHQYSPWQLKIEQMNEQKEVFQLKKRMHLKTQIKMMPLRFDTEEVKTNKERNTQIFSSEQIDLKKYQSIFLRLKQARQIKMNTENAQNSLKSIFANDNSINWISFKAKDENKYIQGGVNNASKKVQNSLMKKKKSFNSIKQTTYCLIDVRGQQQGQEYIKSLGKTNCQLWKNRNISLKRKSSKKKNQILRGYRKQNGGKSLNRAYKSQYQSSNPFTRLLYQKYMNTISLCRTSKADKIDFL